MFYLVWPSCWHLRRSRLHWRRSRARNRASPTIRPIVATYEVYVGGIHFLTADILFQEGAAKYRAQVKGQTYGILYKVFPWNTELDAQGQIKDDRFVPAEYATHDLWGKKAKTTETDFRQRRCQNRIRSARNR